MRPPPQRNFVGIAVQLRPKFGTPSGPTPAPIRNYFEPLNTDSLLRQACIRGYEKDAMPLLTVNRFRSKDPSGDYSRSAPAPRLPRRPNVMAPILVRTFEPAGPNVRSPPAPRRPNNVRTFNSLPTPERRPNNVRTFDSLPTPERRPNVRPKKVVSRYVIKKETT